MVTAEEIRCEPKHVSAYMLDKSLRLIFIANKGAMVAVGGVSRRYTIADVSDELVHLKRTDRDAYHTYFSALYREMAEGGLAAFVELVTKRWRFDRAILRETVRTEAHADHVRANLSSLDRWVVEAAERGAFVDPRGICWRSILKVMRQSRSNGRTEPMASPYRLAGSWICSAPPCPVRTLSVTTERPTRFTMHSQGSWVPKRTSDRSGSRWERCFIVRDLASERRELAARQLIRDAEYDDDDEGYQDQDDPMVIRVQGYAGLPGRETRNGGLCRDLAAIPSRLRKNRLIDTRPI